MEYFQYGEKEIAYLKSKDKLLGEAIDSIGIIKREVNPDLFIGLVYNIVGQQISAKATKTVWNRFLVKFGQITPGVLVNTDINEIQQLGVSFRKANYIKEIANKVNSKELIIEELYDLSDDEVIKRLTTLPGIGVWTADMLLLFSMNRMDVLSWGDLAIRRGIMNLYRHKTLDKKRFERYRKRYSPYGSVASLYLWEISKQ